jgi:hypothetical protein
VVRGSAACKCTLDGKGSFATGWGDRNQLEISEQGVANELVLRLVSRAMQGLEHDDRCRDDFVALDPLSQA